MRDREIMRRVRIFIAFVCLTGWVAGCTQIFQSGRKDVPVTDGVVHKVGQNETLEAIAETYAVSPQLLRRRNNLRPSDRLDSGTKLFIPGAKEILYVTTSTKQPELKPDGLEHQVQPGETLITICKAYKSYGVTMEEVQRVNNITDSSLIFVGQTLWIPRAKEVKFAEIRPVTIVSEQLQNSFKKDPRVQQKVVAKATPPANQKPLQKEPQKQTPLETKKALPKVTPTAAPKKVAFPRKVKQFGPKPFQWPLKENFSILRKFNKSLNDLNPGIDLGAETGTEVFAAADGEVRLVEGVTGSFRR